MPLPVKKPNLLFYLIIIFTFSLIPFAATLIQHYPDEWHYINSVFIMQQSGDYLTPLNHVPYNVSGLLRLNKPIISYWAIAAEFKIFGIHVLSLRLFFLLAGIGTILLTAAIAKRVFQNQATLYLAVIILMTQVQFILASMRAIPDIILVFFLTLSAYGVLNFIPSPRSSPERAGAFSWWCFYGGAALAIETKGMLALLFVAYSLIFLMFTHREVFSKNRLSQLLAAITSIIIASGWYLVMWLKHGDLFIHAFLFDQVTWRLHHSIWLPLINIPYTFLILGLCLLPWILLAVLAAIRRFQILTSPIYIFILGWSCLLVIVIGCGTNISPRYLLPLGPLLAILCADLIIQASWQQRASRYSLQLMLVLFVVGALVAALIVAQMISIGSALALLIISLAIAIFIYRAGRLQKWFNAWVGTGLLLLLLLAISFIPLSSLVMPDPAQQIVNSINLLSTKEQTRLDFAGPNRLASNIRLLSGEKIIPNYLGASANTLTSQPSFPLLISAEIATQLQLPGLSQQKIIVSKSLSKISIQDFLRGLLTWKLPAVINSHQEEYWIIFSEFAK